MTLEEAYALLGGDLAETLGRLGDRALLARHLRRFPEDGAMAALRSAVVSGDEEAIWRAAHGLRGACRALGLERLAEAAEGCMAAPEGAWPLLEREYARAVAVIELVSDDVEQGAENVERARRFDGLRALMVEDDRLCAEVAAAVLAGLGLTVRVAREGVEALKMASLGGFDCVFLDAHLPGTDVPSLARDIRRALPDAPIFGLTAGLRPGEEARLLAAGMRACLPKPLRAEGAARMLAESFPGYEKSAIS